MTIPTYSELYNQILTDLQTKLGVKFILGKLVLNAFAGVQAAKLKIFYTSATFVYKNIFVDTADPEAQGGTLERFGRVKLGRDPNPATAGEYNLTVTGVSGFSIPKNTTFKSLDSSTSPDKLFVLDTEYIFTSTSGIIKVRSLEIGTDSRLAIADNLQVTAPIINVDSFAVVDSIVTTPTEAEDIEDYRAKVIAAYQQEPQGGARIDYRLWSQEVAGVRTSYPYVKDGDAGVVQLYVEAEIATSTDGRGTPSQSLLDDVEANIEPEKIPMTVYDVEYLAINTLPVDVQVLDLSDSGLLSSISAAITAFLVDIRPFIDGADNANDRSDKLYFSDIFTVVRNTIGSSATFSNIVLKVDSVTISSFYEFTNGDIPYTNDVT
jgi:uncharacterized phage protein gp47/JayE